MSSVAMGELIPVGGGDPIPLIRPQLSIGRRESCDICLRFPNISGLHAHLSYKDGYWQIKDLGSTNGIKVNGTRVPGVQSRPLRPGDEIAIAKRRYTIQYELTAGRHALEELMEDDVMSQSLLEKAGLVRPERETRRPRPKLAAPPPDDEPDSSDER